MRRRLILAILVAFCIISGVAIVQACNKEATYKFRVSGTQKLDIVAGCSAYIKYTIRYDGKTPKTCYFYYKINPDSRGFSIINKYTFKIYHGTNTYRILIKTNFNLKPGAYYFTGYFSLHPLTGLQKGDIDTTPPTTNPNDEINPPAVVIPEGSPNYMLYAVSCLFLLSVTLTLLFFKKEKEEYHI